MNADITMLFVNSDHSAVYKWIFLTGVISGDE